MSVLEAVIGHRMTSFRLGCFAVTFAGQSFAS